MANTQRVVDIIFNGIDNVSEMTGKIGTNLSRVGTVVEDVTAPFASLADGILKIEAAIGALAIGGLAYAITKSIDFEAASADLNKVLGEESDRLREAQDKALELSQAYGVSSSEVLASMANFKQAGFSLSESMTLTKASLDLVIAGDLDAAEASDILVASLKGFKAPAEDSIRLTDLLNEVSNNYATNVRELGVGMATLSPIARGMGFSMEETAGILTPVIEIFRSGDEAATALKTGLLKLIDDSKPVRDALESIGVSQTDANGAMRSGKDILYDVANAFQGLDQNQKMYVASQLVGIHQAARMVEVFDGLGKTTEITSVAMRAAGSAANEVRVRLETAEVTVNRFKAGFENLGIAIGTEFLEATKGAVEGGISIEETLRNLVKGGTFDPVFSRIRAFGEEFGDLLEGIAAAMPAAFEKVEFEGLLESIDMLKGSLQGTFQAIFGDLDLTTPEGLAKAIQKVVDVIRVLTAETAGIVTGLNDFFEGLGKTIDKMVQMDNQAAATSGTWLGWAKAIHEIAGMVGSFTSALDVLAGASLVNAATNLGRFVTGVGGLRTALGFLTGPAGIIIAVGTALAGLGTYLVSNRDQVNEYALKLGNLVTGFIGVKEAHAGMSNAFDLSEEQISALKTEIDGLNDSLEANFGILRGTPEQQKLLDEQSARVYEELKKFAASMNLPPVEVDVKTDKIIEAGKTLNENLPEKRKIEVDLEKERIKAQAEIITASIEAETEKWKSMFESVNTGIESTGEVLTSFWETLAGGNLDIGQTMEMERYIEEENDRRSQEFELQKKLTEQQIELNKLKIDALARGDALITIDGSGLQPHLEGFMFEVLEAIQVRVNATGAEFLLGIS